MLCGFRLLKQWVAFVYLRWIKKPQRLLPKCDADSTDASVFGLLPSEVESSLENPRELRNDKNSIDQISVSGFDKDGNALVARLVRRPNRCADTWVYLKTANGDEYQLPNHPDGRVFHTDGRTFSANGLTFEVLEPLRRWRISFNGMLRKGIKHALDEKYDNNAIHVRFNMIWSPFHAPFDGKFNVNANFLSEAIAVEKWTLDFFKSLNSHSTDWYDQWGQLRGTLMLGADEDRVLLLRGRKFRCFGIRHMKSIHRYANLDIYCEDGSVVHIQSECREGGLTNFSTGYVIYCDGSIEMLKYCSFKLPYFGEDEVIPSKFCIHLKTSNRSYHLHMNVSTNGFTVYEGDSWDLKVRVKLIDASLNNLNARGVLELGYRQRDGYLPPKHSSVTFLKETEIENPDPKMFVVSLTNPMCRSGSIVGGKGMSLGLMKSLDDEKFIVPSGLCITVAAYWHHLSKNPSIKKAIQDLQDICWKIKDGNLQDECKIVDIVSTAPLVPDLQDAIKSGLREVFKDSLKDVKLAVRSSAIGEDSDETSAAGQNDTILGVTFGDDVWNAVTKCWASQFSFIAVQYKRQHGQLINAGMSVVLQEMVPADAAGVLFTRDPVTGSRENIVITANYGLGESVVSAAAEPDTILLIRTWYDKLSVSKKVLGKKAMKIILKEDGGIEENVVSEHDVVSYSISDGTAIKLGELGIFLEQAFGNPRDIEWAISKGQIYLLQSRAITTSGLDNSDKYQTMHELDTSLLTDDELCTKANLGEVFPGATTPLSISSIIRVFNISLQRMRQKIRPRHPFPLYYNDALSISYNHAFLNVYQMLVNGTDDTRSMREKIVGFAFLGRDFIKEKAHQAMLHRYGLSSLRDKFFVSLPSLKQFLSTDSTLDECKKRYEQGFCIELEKNDSATDMYGKITEKLHELKYITTLHLMSTRASTVWNTIVFGILVSNEKEISVKVARDSSVLQGSCADVISADVPSSIRKLTDVIRASNNGHQFSEMKLKDALHWLSNSNEAPKEQFHQLLKDHGHRCLKEFDLHSLSWRMDPSPLIPILQNSLKSECRDHAYKNVLTPEHAVNKLEVRLSSISKKILLIILPVVQKSVGIREHTKSYYIKVIDGFRKAFCELAEQMVHEGRLPDPNLIFLMTFYEIGQLLKFRSARIISKIVRRKNMYPSLDNLRFPDVSYGIPEPINIQASETGDRKSSISLKAFPASQGIVTGIARVVMQVSEAESIQTGDILITYSTDIGWSPYFPLLSGVVTEIGGIISHGAVIAREYGLPCLVGAEGATRLFRSGDEVLLDATKGVLELISEPEV